MNKKILENIPDKLEYKETTSLKFKSDLIDMFEDIGDEYSVLELGTNHGHTTRILSHIFKEVTTMDWKEEPNLRMAKELNTDVDNINYVQKDVYNESWDVDNFDVILIDCCHTTECVVSDIKNAIANGKDNMYLIFDDYGHPKTGVKQAIQMIESEISGFEQVAYIGESAGNYLLSYGQDALVDWEGVIYKYEK